MVMILNMLQIPLDDQRHPLIYCKCLDA